MINTMIAKPLFPSSSIIYQEPEDAPRDSACLYLLEPVSFPRCQIQRAQYSI